MNKKKFLSAVISMVMAFGCMAYMPQTEVFEPMTAEAESYSGDIAYGDYLTVQKVDEDEDGTDDYVKITGCDESATEIEIPAEIDGLPVTHIEKKVFYDCKALNGVYISDLAAWCNIDFNDNYSNPLCYAKNLYLNGELVKELNIPESVTSISDFAFLSCTSLESVTIPDSVTSIGLGAFFNCFNIASITIENPECEINDSEYTISSITKIYGYTNSTAQAYAEKYGRRFVALDEPAQTTPVISTIALPTTTTTTQTTTTETTSPVDTTIVIVSAITQKTSVPVVSSIVVVTSLVTNSETTTTQTTPVISTIALPTATVTTQTSIPKTTTTTKTTTSVFTSIIYVTITVTEQTSVSQPVVTIVTTTTKPTEAPSEPTMMGDTTLDNAIGTADVVALSKYNANAELFPFRNATAQANADVTHDGIVDSADTLKLIEYLLGSISVDELSKK